MSAVFSPRFVFRSFSTLKVFWEFIVEHYNMKTPSVLELTPKGESLSQKMVSSKDTIFCFLNKKNQRIKYPLVYLFI